jgi:hypothetical protein
MNRKLLPFVAAFLILAIVFGSTPLSFAVAATNGPKLEVTTIPQDDQKREKGIVILGLPSGKPACDPTGKSKTLPQCGPQDLISQHKLLVTYNGLTMIWQLGYQAGVTIKCNWLEKDKINVVPDPKTHTGQQFDEENLMTKLVDVSDFFVCKPRWKYVSYGTVESAGVLDVYYIGPADGHFIADTILIVQAYITVGRVQVWGSDIQDICVLGWTMGSAPASFTKPDGEKHYVFANALGSYVSCEDLALYQRDQLGIKLDTGQD